MNLQLIYIRTFILSSISLEYSKFKFNSGKRDPRIDFANKSKNRSCKFYQMVLQNI